MLTDTSSSLLRSGSSSLKTGKRERKNAFLRAECMPHGGGARRGGGTRTARVRACGTGRENQDIV